MDEPIRRIRGDGRLYEVASNEEIADYFRTDPSTKRCAEHFGLSRRTMRQRLAKIRELGLLNAEADPGREGKLEQLISSVPLTGPDGSKLRAVDVKIWGTAAKNADGEIVTKGLDGIHAHYKLDESKSVQWPPIQPHYIVEVKSYEPVPQLQTNLKKVAVIGDVQIGFWREGGELVPFHDEAAIDVQLQILAYYRPDKVVIIGDFLDFPELGRYRKEPAFAFTLNPSIAYATELLAKIRATVGPHCEIIYIPGNHEARLTSAIVDNLSALYNIRRHGDAFPTLSIPFLLQFEKFKIHCEEQYPAGQHWLADDLVCTHAPDKRLRATQICGHLVRATVDSETFHYRDGAKTYKTYIVPGLGNYGGKPADKNRLCRTNIPSNVARSNAEQACATVEVTADGSRHNVTVWPIVAGFAFFKDTAFQGVAKPWHYLEPV